MLFILDPIWMNICKYETEYLWLFQLIHFGYDSTQQKQKKNKKTLSMVILTLVFFFLYLYYPCTNIPSVSRYTCKRYTTDQSNKGFAKILLNRLISQWWVAKYTRLSFWPPGQWSQYLGVCHHVFESIPFELRLNIVQYVILNHHVWNNKNKNVL